MVEKAAIAILLADAAVTAAAGQRVRPVSQAQFDAFPFVTLRVSDYEQIATHKGPSGLAKTTITVDAWAETYQAATQLQNKVRTAIAFKKGTFGEVSVRNVMPLGKSELHEQAADGRATPIYAVSADYVFLHSE
jgi:hypothetical protein